MSSRAFSISVRSAREDEIGLYLIEVDPSTVTLDPLRTIAGKGIPGFQTLADGWADRAPLGWNPTDATPVADTIVFLLSDLSRGITGEMVHVDGGYHAIGAPPAGSSGAGETG